MLMKNTIVDNELERNTLIKLICLRESSIGVVRLELALKVNFSIKSLPF
jgi:hypothetical protein